MNNLIPQFIHDNFKAGVYTGDFEAISLFIDISGFTAMTESLMAHGKEGAEVLAETLINVFDPLVEVVYGHGGIITTFAGDAFTALFPLMEDSSLNANAPLSATAAAHFIQQNFVEKPTRPTRFGDFAFAVKIGQAGGHVEWGILRSDQQPYRHVYFFKGPAIDACAKAEHLAEKGDWIVTDSVYSVLADALVVEPRTDRYFRVTGTGLKLPTLQQLSPWLADAEVVAAFFPEELVRTRALGEFRDVTTVFIGIPGSPDSSDLQRLITTVLHLFQKYGGMLARFDFGDKGCNLLLFWGAPKRYESDVERSLGFLLDLREAFTSDEIGRFRAGVSQRSMYAGYAGGRRQGEFTCYGRGINLAARLMMNAEWAQVWLGEVAAKAAEWIFEIESKGSYSFKGFAEPVPVWRMNSRRVAGRSILYHGIMVGREAESKQLDNFIQPIFNADNAAIKSKFAGLITVYGDPGMGKSRLIYEFKRRMEKQRLLWWCFCPCDEVLRQSLNPFRHFVRNFFRIIRGDDSENKHRFEAKFAEIVETLCNLPTEKSSRRDEIVAELIRTKSILAGMIPISYPGSLYDQLEPKLRFENTLRSFKNFIRALSLLRPVVISIDDIQWIDADSHQLAAHLTRMMDEFPVAILAASRYRDDGACPTLTVAPNVCSESINLRFLDATGLQAIANAAAGGPVANSVTNFLMDKTKGNPFFAEQLTLGLREQGLFKSENGLFQLDITALSLLNVPTNLSGVLIARLDRLPLDVKTVIQTAAVLGDEFEVPILKEILREGLSLRKELKAAAEAAIWAAQNDIRYIFRHALMRDAAYAMQLKARLREIHLAAAQAFETVYAADLTPHYSTLAYHYERAENFDKAIFYFEKAGDYAKANYQNQKALEFFERLLNLLNNSKNNSSETVVRIIETLHKKGGVLQLIGQWDAAKEAFEHAISLAEPINLLSLLAKGNQFLGFLLWNKGDYQVAKQLQEKALAIFVELDSEIDICNVINNMGIVYWGEGKFEMAIEFYQEALVIAQKLDDKHLVGKVLGNKGVAYHNQKIYDKARTCYEKQLEIAQSQNNLFQTGSASGNMGLLCIFMGNFDEALTNFKRSLEISEYLGNMQEVGRAIGNVGMLYQEQGLHVKALESFQQQLSIAEELGDVYNTRIALSNIGEVYKDQNNFTQAVAYYDRAIAIARASGGMATLATNIFNKAEVYFLQKNYSEAALLLQEWFDNLHQYRPDILFSANVLDAKLAAVSDPLVGINKLTDLFDTTNEDPEKAALHYELWKIKKDISQAAGQTAAEHRRLALDLYNALVEQTPKYLYKNRIDELQK